MKGDYSVNIVTVYTDGSYVKGSPLCGFGAVCIENLISNNPSRVIYGFTKDSDLVALWNVGGEIAAVKAAISHIIEWRYHDEPVEEIHIYHDYIGLSEWANGKWKANKKATKEYKEFIQYHRKYVKIVFHKVKGHSGDKFNEMADRYANLGRNLKSNQKECIREEIL